MAAPRAAVGTPWPRASPPAIDMYSISTIPYIVFSGPKQCSLQLSSVLFSARYGTIPMVNNIYPMLNDIYVAAAALNSLNVLSKTPTGGLPLSRAHTQNCCQIRTLRCGVWNFHLMTHFWTWWIGPWLSQSLMLPFDDPGHHPTTQPDPLFSAFEALAPVVLC